MMGMDTRPELNVSRETLQRLELFGALLGKWNPKINLVSRSSIIDTWSRHILDSAQVFSAAPRSKSWADLGSGGGFPGLVVAILGAEKQPALKVTLIESDQRKSTFLRTVIRETDINCEVCSERIELVDRQEAEIVSARALASLDVLLGYSERHLAYGGTALFHKGVSWKKELDAVRCRWRFDVDVIESQTMPGAAILKFEGISRV
jgi:16S rRNA (guanine527-N7)-methyltransferase